MQPDYAGPFEGQTFYDDAGSTWTYTSKIVARQDPLPGGCGETVITSEGTGSGDFRADGLIVGILAGAVPDDPGSTPSLELGVSTPSIATVQRTESCGTSLDETSGMSGPSLFCDEILDRFHGSWTQDVHNTVTFQCTNGDVKESGTLTSS